MSTLMMADGQSHNCPIEYAALRALLFENKNTQLPAGVTIGPGNPAQWVELPIDGGPLTIARINVVAVRP